ncbi:Asp/Glu/hydantoin racemase [Candidatus Woesearchaeota archaeon]|jgi:glutamate racemase|nr:Asp/Glu/hydantoin racemase [Candidatus Woesearchaeota archaeon]
MKKIGIIAGTKVDTKFGELFFAKFKAQTIGCSISETPQEQTQLQVLNRKQLTEKVQSAIDKVSKEGANTIVIYCNSLSGAIDLEFLRRVNKQKIITPLDVYAKIANNYKVFGLLAANCQSTANIEKLILKINKEAIIIGLGNLNIVNDIENNHRPIDIINNYNLVELCDIISKSGAEIIILGCTHYSYFYEELCGLSNQIILEPSEEMKKFV